MYLLYTNIQDAINDLETIDKKLEYPKSKTQSWDIVKKAHKEDLWFFKKPDGLDLVYENAQEIESVRQYLSPLDF